MAFAMARPGDLVGSGICKPRCTSSVFLDPSDIVFPLCNRAPLAPGADSVSANTRPLQATFELVISQLILNACAGTRLSKACFLRTPAHAVRPRVGM